MTKMSFSTRNHNVTLAVAFIISCVVMLLFFLNKTHEKLEDSRSAFFNLDEKYTTLARQHECKYPEEEIPTKLQSQLNSFYINFTPCCHATLLALMEYKERLENSFMNLKNKKSSTDSETDTLKSELAVLKSSHKAEIQRLHVNSISHIVD
jgi:hypothetical protein